jgi:photosystem II stability/assembly factor-like uncharacterized protein
LIRLALLGSVATLAAIAPPASAGIWTEIPSGTTQNITAIEYQSATRLWFTTAGGAIFTRKPDGSFKQTRPPGGVPLNDIEFQAGGQIGLAAGNGGLLLRSIDGGASWSPVPLPMASDVSCKGPAPIGDINAVRFAGNQRAWLFGSGQAILRSQPGDPMLVGHEWGDANRDTKGTASAADDTCRIKAYNDEGFADAFFVPSNPSVGSIVEGDYSKVFFTSNNLQSAGQEKAGEAGNAGTPGRVLAGDPENPNRMWSVNAQPYGRSTTAYTFDGWQTSAMFAIANPNAREFPQMGPADVDFAGGTVLAAGDAGLILRSIGGVTFFYDSADGELATQRWNAVGLASGADGAVGGDGGRLALTTAANALPVLEPVATPVPTPAATPVATPTPTVTPQPKPKDTRALPVLKGSTGTARIVGGKVRIVVRGKLKAASGCSGSVVLTVKKGKTLLTARTARVGTKCTFNKTISLSRKKVGAAKKLAVTVRFGGNTVLKPTSQNVTVRVKR